MNERIYELTKLTLNGEMCPQALETEFDRNDIFLPEHEMQTKRIHDYVMNQKPILTELQTMTGQFLMITANPKNRILGDYMHSESLPQVDNFLMPYFYKKPIENLSTFEWEHASPDYGQIIKKGISGLIADIEASKEAHKGDAKKTDFLNCLKSVAETLIEWAHKCSEEALSLSVKTDNAEYKENLRQMSERLKRIPEQPAESFRDAVQAIYVLFSYEPDSLGTLDRTLYPYYKKDLESGAITREDAKAVLQELFLSLQANTPKSSHNFTRGGQSHFCVGGYDENHEDAFNDLSMLIIEALTELPTYIPEVSLRWTRKLSSDIFNKVLETAVNDSNSRIAFINDEVKIGAAMDIAKIPYETACKYTSVGCNEVAYPGSMFVGSSNTNILRSVENTMFNRETDITAADTWEKFFEIYKTELCGDLDLMLDYDNKFNSIRAREDCWVTALLFPDCIKEGKSFTQGACKYAVSGAGLIGIPNVIDSLSVIKQFVYDEKIVSMRELVDALKDNWEGHKELLSLIKKRGKFFGNDDETSNAVAALLTETIYTHTKDKTNFLGYHLMYGNLQGYNEHHKIFGSAMRATPDGRSDGEMLKFGLGQSGGYDREGLTALLNSVAKCDKHGIISGGPSVTNVYLDEQLVKNEANFPKTAKLLETYFRNGGSQFQLNYASKEDLINAKSKPEEYSKLRVRVSGFSDFFVNLNEPIQDDIIKRTVKS